MGMKITWHCDGCPRQIYQTDIEMSNQLYVEWAGKRGLDPASRQSNPEVYCDRCRGKAIEFWESKIAFVENCLKEMRGRIERHKNKFWCSTPKSNVVTMK